MKVLWLSPYPYPGNDQHPSYWITEWADFLAQNSGLQIDVVTLSPLAKGITESLTKSGYAVTYLKVPRGYFDLATFYKITISRLRNYVESVQGNYDLVHVHGIENLYHSACVNLNLPVIISMQGSASESIKYFKSTLKQKAHFRLRSYYEKKYLPYFKNFFCRTKWDTQFVKSNTSSPLIFHNWEMLRDDFGNIAPDADSRKILFTGGSNFLKGLNTALSVFNRLSETGKSFQLVITGKCNVEQILNQIKSKFKKINPENISFMGFIETQEMVRVMSESFCYIHPSLLDNSPNSVCESQLAGLPVLASNVGGIPSLIDDGRTGFLLNGNINTYAQKIELLFNNRELWNSISTASKKKAKVRHNKDNISKITIEAYLEIIKQYNC